MPEQQDRANPLSIVRAVALSIVVGGVGFFLTFAWPPRPTGLAKSTEIPLQTQTTRQYVQRTAIGRDCVQCHRVIVRSFELDAHGKSAKFLKDSRAANCEICHENSEKHAETSTKTQSSGDVVNPAKLASAPANESCLQCHSMDRSHFNWNGGKHDRSDMSCLSCHNVHHVKLLNRMWAHLADTPEREAAEIIDVKLPEKMLASFTVEETCLSCHKEQRKALYQRSTQFFRTEHWATMNQGQFLVSQPFAMKV